MAQKEVGNPDDRNPPEFFQPQEMVVARDDPLRAALNSALQHSIISIVLEDAQPHSRLDELSMPADDHQGSADILITPREFVFQDRGQLGQDGSGNDQLNPAGPDHLKNDFRFPAKGERRKKDIRIKDNAPAAQSRIPRAS